jgi:hypothetical protein
VKTILALLMQFFRWLASRNEYKATPEGQNEVRTAAENKAEAEIQKGSKAVQDGNEDEVNRRLKKLGLCLAVIVLAAGCLSSKVVYVAQADKAVFVPAGKQATATTDSWLVPTGVFGLLLEKAERYDNLQKENGK